jgi:hypothetical protein
MRIDRDSFQGRARPVLGLSTRGAINGIAFCVLLADRPIHVAIHDRLKRT